ncbi:MAG: ribosome small subunit-dependent GTPase A [Chitinispirillaceae bacterium]|nr:ribosome small subunit-dependent GTPase A [Chitinispirillaceae bacterium]
MVEEQKNYFVVDTAEGSFLTTTSGSLKKQRKKPCTGDLVDLTIIDTDTRRGVITTIRKRTTYIKRPALANCSLLLCLSTFKEPPLNLETLDRLLVYALLHELQPCVVFNKADILSDDERDELERVADVYRHAGHPVVTTSAFSREGLDALLDLCSGRLAAFAGPSGVGKSTLLSTIFPDIDFRIGNLSCCATRGTHTTTNVTLHPLGNKGYIADTPGLAWIDLPAVPEENIVFCFDEIARNTGKCRFNNCIHDNEPGCAVDEEVKKGIIAPWRHAHYLKFRNEMIGKRKQYR